MKAPHTAEEDRIPIFEKAIYSIGINTDSIASLILTSTLWMPFFNMGMKMPAFTLGVILMFIRIWDGITDTVMGNISDNTRTRWGRRRPWMVLGAVLCAIVYPAFWYMPEDWDFTAKTIYLSAVGITFFTCFTMWSVSYYSLQMEMTPDYDERTRLTAWMAVSGKLAASFGGIILTWATSDMFFNEAKGENDIILGMRSLCWVISLLILLFGAAPAFFLKEKYYASDSSKQKKEKLWPSIKESLDCRPLWILIAISFCLVLAFSSVGSLGYYVNTYYVFDGDKNEAAKVGMYRGLIITVFGIGLVPVWTWLGTRLGKKPMVIGLIFVSILGHLSLYIFLSPATPYLQLLPAVMEACTLSAVWMFLPSMKADIADYDELNTSKRREGALNAFYSWFIKVAFAVGVLLAGIAMTLSGYSPEMKVLAEDITSRMYHIYILTPAIILAIGLIFAFIYPFNREKMNEIRKKIEARRGKII